jgi:hypothetical protein
VPAHQGDDAGAVLGLGLGGALGGPPLLLGSLDEGE